MQPGRVHPFELSGADVIPGSVGNSVAIAIGISIAIAIGISIAIALPFGALAHARRERQPQSVNGHGISELGSERAA